MLEVKKQGSNDNGVWVIGTLDLGGIVIDSIFNTNLQKPIEDTTQPIKVKKVKISNRLTKDNQRYVSFSLVF